MRALWLLGLVVVLGFGVTLVASGRSSGGNVSELRTPFESLNGARWTSLREERQYLRRLDATSPRVTISTIGRSVQGRPIRLVRVGPPRTRKEIAAGSSVLVICAQHGDEPAGREACLNAARDYARAKLDTTMLLVPTANPDGFAAGRRHNADGVDINRDYLRYETPEARALSAVIRDYSPDLLGDMHEYPWSDGKVLYGDPGRLHRNVDPRIARLTSTLNESYVAPALQRAGFATGYYPSNDPQANESVMRQQAGLRHIPGLLLETSAAGRLPPLQRVKAHRTAIAALVKMMRERRPELASATGGAARRAIAAGAAGNRRYYYTSPTVYSDTPPCGYRLTDEQYRDVAQALRSVGITATPDNGSWTISAAQAQHPTIGLLLDARAARKLTAAQSLPC